MIRTFGFRNLGTEICVGRWMAAYRFKEKGHVTKFFCDIT
jgi:hypothetical protein